MRITSKGQVTIPQHVREQAGLLPGTEVEFVVEDGGTVRIMKAQQGRKETRGERLVRRLWNSATARPRLTTDEIMRLTRGE
jgi:AbrB family looped-hinge helix DNA binding protein